MWDAVRVQKKINDVGCGAVRRNFFKELLGTVGCGNTFFFEKFGKMLRNFPKFFLLLKCGCGGIF